MACVPVYSKPGHYPPPPPPAKWNGSWRDWTGRTENIAIRKSNFLSQKPFHECDLICVCTRASSSTTDSVRDMWRLPDMFRGSREGRHKKHNIHFRVCLVKISLSSFGFSSAGFTDWDQTTTTTNLSALLILQPLLAVNPCPMASSSFSFMTLSQVSQPEPLDVSTWEGRASHSAWSRFSTNF